MTEKIVETSAELFEWQKGLLADKDLTFAQKNLLSRLILHLDTRKELPNTNVSNPNYLLCNPGAETLALETALKPRGVKINIDEAERLGWIICTHAGGRGHGDSARYAFPMAKAIASLEDLNAALELKRKKSRVHHHAKKGARRCTRTLRTIGTLQTLAPSARLEAPMARCGPIPQAPSGGYGSGLAKTSSGAGSQSCA